MAKKVTTKKSTTKKARKKEDEPIVEVIEALPTSCPGRKIGSGNVITLETRQRMKAFLSEHFEEFEESFSQLSPRDKVDAYLTIYRHAVPPTKKENDQDLDSATKEFVINTFFQ